MKNLAWAGLAQGFRYVLASQVLVLVLGFAKAFLIPVILGISHYGYWQLYVFYTVYVGVFGLGFNDGMYLRYGGYDKANLPMGAIRASVRLYALWLLVAGAIFAWIFSGDADPNRRLTMYWVAVNVVVMGLLAVFSQTLQATNQLKQFGIFNAADKVFFLAFLPPLFIFKIDSFLYLIGVDLASKVFVLVAVSVAHKEFLIGASAKLGAALRESSANIGAGIQLMIANLSGMLVLGVGRFIIEYFDTLENYAYYAFGVSMTSLALIGITALSVVTYPVLKQLPESSYLGFYDITNRRLFAFNCLMLLVYFPVIFFIDWLLPKYAPVVPYLSVLFVITALQAKMQLLNNTYYKAMRRETAMLTANVTSLLIVTGLSVIGYYYMRSIESIAYAALLTMVYRVHSSERYLRRQLGDRGYGIVPIEIISYGAFLVVTSLLEKTSAFLVSVMLLGTCLFLMRRELMSMLNHSTAKKPP